MKKWKKLLLPAMCVFMLQTPVIANAEVAGSDGAAAVVENPVAAPTPALLNGIINRANPIFHIGMNNQIVKHFGEMLDCARAQKSGFQAVLAGITMHTIGLIYSINKNQDCGPVSMQKIQEACVLMRENIYDKFTPEDIAESINMSYSNFRKSFKQYTGIAPHQYMLQLKLSKIKDLLSSTEMSIQDIAMKLNFESADYFSYFFRSKTGINPLSYRKEIEKQREKAKKNSH